MYISINLCSFELYIH